MKKKLVAKLIILAFKSAVRSTRHPRAEEYIREAEHQDGEEYWENFANREEVLEDFARYIA